MHKKEGNWGQFGATIKKTGVCIVMDKCKKQMIEGVTYFERKIY